MSGSNLGPEANGRVEQGPSEEPASDAKPNLIASGIKKPQQLMGTAVSRKSITYSNVADEKRRRPADVIPFNPLDKRVLGASIAEAMIGTPVYPLFTPVPIKGAGLYALYYHGNFPVYAELAKRNTNGQCDAPIYVGQALPQGVRKGASDDTKKNALRDRVSKHRRSIEPTELKVEDFSYRVLVLDDTFIRLGEMSLISIYRPIWNTFLEGFGNNVQGKGRDASLKSRWDTLHPGRKQATKHDDRHESAAQIAAEVEMALQQAAFIEGRSFVIAESQTGEGGEQPIDLDDVTNVDEPVAADPADNVEL